MKISALMMCHSVILTECPPFPARNRTDVICTVDDTDNGLERNCNVSCFGDLVFEYPAPTVFFCGVLTNFTWSFKNGDGDSLLENLPSCVRKSNLF